MPSHITHFDSPMSNTQTTTSTTYTPGNVGLGAVMLYMSKMDGNVSVFVHVYAKNVDPTPSDPPNNLVTVQVYDFTNNAEITTLTTANGTQTYLTKEITDYVSRSGCGDIAIGVNYKSDNAANTSTLYHWHLVRKQNGVTSPITKTYTVVSMSDANATSATSYTECAWPKRFAYDSTKFDGTISVFATMVMRETLGGGGTVYGELYDRTAAAQIAGSELTSTSTSFSLQVTGALTLTSGNELTIRRKVSAAGNQVSLTSALLYICQDGSGTALTKTLAVGQMANTRILSSSGIFSNNPWLYKQDDFQGCTVAGIAEYVGGSVAGGINSDFDVIDQNDVTLTDDNVSVTGAAVTQSAATYTRFQSGALTMPNTSEDLLDSYTDGSGTGFNGVLSCARVLLTITSLTSNDHTLAVLGSGT